MDDEKVTITIKKNDDDKNINDDNDVDEEAVPLGLTTKAVCMQVSIRWVICNSFSF